ncbi:receptor-transporting protein 4 [Saccopteryx leptura]|uniref:receptor-transporting protein 4 n=1 Tax=Saccopteryx leptura TaxID=249018 RepID=UPI00339CE5BB
MHLEIETETAFSSCWEVNETELYTLNMKSKHQEKVILDVEKWEQIFQELIQEVKPRARWTLRLNETLQPNCVAQGWKQYQQKAFGRFWCSSCKRNWYSAQVQTVCHMYLENRRSQGQVLMRLFRQRCKKCCQSQYEKPEFSPESAMRILNNLVWRIKEKYYGDGIKKFSEIPVIPEVPLEGSHDMANCEACSLGFCVQIVQNGMTTPSKSPFTSMKIGSSLPHIGDIHGQKQTRKQSAEAQKAQGSGCSSKHERSGPSHATTGSQVPVAGPQPKQETGQQPIPGAQQQAAHGTGSQIFKVITALPPGWTNLQTTRAVDPLHSGLAASKSTLGTRSQAAQWTYSQALRLAGQQSKQEVGSRASQGTGLQATVAGQQSKQEVGSRATQGTGLQATKTGQQSKQEVGSRATQGTGLQATKTGQQSKQEVGSRATQGTGLQATKAGQQSKQEVGSRATQGTGLQATVAGQQSKQEVGSRATQGTGLQATKGTDTQPTRREGHTAAHRYGTPSGTQAFWRRQDSYSPRGPASDRFTRPSNLVPPNNSTDQHNFLVWGCVCVAALWAIFISKYLK